MSELKHEAFFDKEMTNVLKGIGIIMMLAHHCFTNPDWWMEGVDYPLLRAISPVLCNPLKTCVSMFAFITGYTYCFQKGKSYSYSIRKITDLLINYWFVYCVLALIAVLSVGYKYTFEGVVKEAVALYRPTMTFCWYVMFYYSTMLILPIYSKVAGKNVVIDLLLSIIVIPITLNSINNTIETPEIKEIFNYFIGWAPCVFMGYIFASHNVFTRMEHVIEKHKKVVWGGYIAYYTL